MAPLSRTNSSTPKVSVQIEANATSTYRVNVPQSDRWRIHHRLQELTIPCWCLPDGSLRVDIQHGVAALLLRSVVQQFVASRQEMVAWLDRCWDIE